jgi:hypothetical protein
MNRKLLVLITITILVGGAAVFINNIESEVPAGTMEIRNKLNSNYLVVDKITGYVIQGENDDKNFCWLPILQPDNTTAFQYVCSGKYHNYYLDVDDSVNSDKYLRLMARELLVPGGSWHVESKGYKTYAYVNSKDKFKGYYMAIQNDGLPKIIFGDIGPRARWYQNINLKKVQKL